MPYPEPIVQPMREELSRNGVTELRTAADVDNTFANTEGKTHLLVINSICGCAAANARPAVLLSQQADIQPDEYVTVFAGQDVEATARARDYMVGIQHSSPFIALFKDGDPVYVLERRHIEGRSASTIALDLVTAYEHYCSDEPKTEAPEPESGESGEQLPSTFKSIL